MTPADDAGELMALLHEDYEHIEALRDAIAAHERRQDRLVQQLRTEHITWESIGNALGTSKQAAQQRFGQ